MSGSSENVLNDSDIDEDLRKREGIPPGVLSKSAEVVWNVGDGNIPFLGVRKRLKRLEMRGRVDSILAACFGDCGDGRD